MQQNINPTEEDAENVNAPGNGDNDSGYDSSGAGTSPPVAPPMPGVNGLEGDADGVPVYNGDSATPSGGSMSSDALSEIGDVPDDELDSPDGPPATMLPATHFHPVQTHPGPFAGSDGESEGGNGHDGDHDAEISGEDDGVEEDRERRKTHKPSIDEVVENARVMIANAAEDIVITTALEEWGYGSTELDEGQALLNETIESILETKDALGSQFSSTDELDRQWDRAHRVLMACNSSARTILENDRGPMTSLTTRERRRKDIGGWITQARAFYRHSMEPHILPKLEEGGLKQATIEKAESTLEELLVLTIEQQGSIGDKVVSTQERTRAYDRLRKWLAAFKAMARIALADNPAHLQKMGLKSRT